MIRPFRREPGSRQAQRGQALIYGLFVLIGGLAALFFLFNSGQVVREKTKLVNTADAVAYSGGVMNARALNFHAYTNRAMLANTVAIAQLVSVSSWINYVNTLSQFGTVVMSHRIQQYPLFYPAYSMAAYYATYMQPYHKATQDGVEGVAKLSDKINQALMVSQAAAYAGLMPVRHSVMQQVADENYRDDGSVSLDPPIPLALSGDYPDFVQRYSGQDRGRFAEVAELVAQKDPFVKKRNWDLIALPPWTCPYAPDFLFRRGGTELLSFDEWKAVDSVSEWYWKVVKGVCIPLERAVAWGSANAADDPTRFDFDPTHYGGSLATNPLSTTNAMLGVLGSSHDWGYSGLPSFYDLKPKWLAQDDPKLLLAIRLRRDKKEMQVSGARSEIKPSDHLNAYEVDAAGGSEMVAVSTSEVYFSRPVESRENVHGRSRGKPREIGSLFNPYWQVRLIQSDQAVQAAQALQGAVLP